MATILHRNQDEDAGKERSVERAHVPEESEEQDWEDQSSTESGEPVELNIYSMVTLSASLDFHKRRQMSFPGDVRNHLEASVPVAEVRRSIIDALCKWISLGDGYFTKPVSDVCSGALNQSVAQLCQAAAAQYVLASYSDCFMGQPLHTSSKYAFRLSQ